MNSKTFKIKNRIWISNENGTFLGEGRVRLLEKIDECGSISKAAKQMNMSYKKAWGLVQSMNEQSHKPIVERYVGGKNGGGSRLSDHGHEQIRLFKEINCACQKFLEKEFASLLC